MRMTHVITPQAANDQIENSLAALSTELRMTVLGPEKGASHEMADQKVKCFAPHTNERRQDAAAGCRKKANEIQKPSSLNEMSGNT